MFTVYSKPACGFCDKAKSLIASKGLAFNEVIIDVGQPKDASKTYCTVDELRQLVPDVRSVPVIFQNGNHIGGYSDLAAAVA